MDNDNTLLSNTLYAKLFMSGIAPAYDTYDLDDSGVLDLGTTYILNAFLEKLQDNEV